MTTFRRIAYWIHLVAATLVFIGIVVQVYLASGQLFGTDSLDTHRDSGWLVHNLELLVLVAAVAAWLPRVDIGWSFLLALLGTVQVLLNEGSDWIGAIHGVGALLVLALAAVIVYRDARGLGLTRGSRGASSAAPPQPLP